MTNFHELPLPWQACVELAWEAYCDNCLPIGAVVTDSTGKIMSRGRNRIYEKVTTNARLRGQQFAHAEMEALHALDYDVADPHAWALYTTTEPCPMCLGTFYMSGIRTLHYASREPWAGSANLLGASWYLSVKPIKVFHPMDAALELVIMGMFVVYDVDARGEEVLGRSFYQRYREIVPESVPFGTMLHRKGTLQSLRQQKATTNEMYSELVSILEK
jgi:tRNA(adenine34) deaminase